MSTWTGFYSCPQFEIGKAQAVELFGPSADVDDANRNRAAWGMPSTDSFLVMAFEADDGTYYHLQFIGWFSSVAAIVESIETEKWYSRRFGRTCHFELFNVVDDGDLWQSWEYASACACKDGGQATNYHVYESGKCVLDILHEVPQVLYSIRFVDATYNPSCRAKYYVDPLTWFSMVNYYQDRRGLNILALDTIQANMAGLHVIDDWQRDEGLADCIKLLVIYLWG